MRHLRRTLASIALAAPLAGCGVQGPGGTGPCPMYDETVPVPAMPDAQTMTDLVACRADATMCVPLCRDVSQLGLLFTTCELVTDPATGAESVHYAGTEPCHTGRRPAGFRCGRRGGNAVGAYLAQQAELEAASVRAFEDLHADLVAHDAPIALRRAARRAAADEVRHAAICDQLARAHGMVPRYAAIAAAARRSRRQLAIDNAVEGCVRETYGAVVAGYQARAAADPSIRGAMHTIWRDEASHAALSWRLHRWLAPQLDDADRRAVAATVAAARRELAEDPEEAAELRCIAGVPAAEAAHAMLAALDARVWNASFA